MITDLSVETSSLTRLEKGSIGQRRQPFNFFAKIDAMMR
jgi:hypothetical protein